MSSENTNKYSKMSKHQADDPATDEPDAGRTSSFMGLVSDAMSNTGMQGLPNAYRASSKFRKIMWTLICLLGICVMTWQITLAIMKFYTYPTSTTVEYVYKTSLEFPAITICNMNPIKKTLLESSADAAELNTYVQAEYTTFDAEFGDNASIPTQFDYGYDSSYSYSYYTESEDDYYSEDYSYDDVSYSGVEDDEFDFVEDFIATMSKLNKTQRLSLGHQLSDMIISCTWQGKKCRTQQFNVFNNYLYGNCYTFNSGVPDKSKNSTGKTLKTNKIGPLYGFSLELYIEQDEYISNLADAAGIRLMIHNQTHMPFPEDYGISLKPGSKTSIGITRRDTYRAPAPHGSCIDYTTKENTEKNAFLDDISTVKYSVPACRKTCFQKALMANCSCIDYKVPTSETLEAYKNLGNISFDTLLPCDDDVEYALKKPCIKNMTAAFLTNSLGCSSLCHVPCFEVEFPYTVSYSQWPSVASEERVLNALSMKSADLWNLIHNDTITHVEKKQFMNDNFLKLEVYFSDFNKEVVITSPSFDALALISDLGGQAGLWVGVSVIAFFELFELVFDLVVLVIKYTNRKVKESKNGGDKIMPDDTLMETMTTPNMKKEHSITVSHH